ncbi:MAG: site-specific integrase [Lachnospiraceae bacterium]|nr:site-specific integrase [Lachnospiraceae bacterium]
MASIVKRGSSYRITVSNGRDAQGKQLLETATFTPDPKRTEKQNQKALQEFALDFERKVKSGKYLDGEKILFSEFVEKWFAEYAEPHLQPTTVANYQDLYRVHVRPALGQLKLARIQPFQLNTLYNTMLKERKDGKAGGYSANTIKRVHAFISSVMETAVKWNVITENPCERVSTPKQERDTSDIHFFTQEETLVFLDAVDAQLAAGNIQLQHKVMFHLALYCGIRRGELVALEWSDFDFEQNTVSISKNTVIVKGKPLTKIPKNKSSVRIISVPDDVMQLIKKYKTEQQRYRLSLGSYWQGNNYVFIQHNGRQMYPSTPYNTIKRVIRKYNEGLSADEQPLSDITFHDTRHTSATLLISGNMDVRTVSNRLGHAQTSTTMNIYSHALKKKDQAAADTLSNMLKRNA